MICPTMRNHSQLMMKFVTQMKCLMVLVSAESSDGIETAILRKTSFSKPQDLLKMIDSHLPQDGVFKKFLPMCGCSSNNPSAQVSQILSIKSHDAENNFCYHRKVSSDLYGLFVRLHKFIQQWFTELKMSSIFKEHFSPVEEFQKLVDFHVCACINVVHQRLDFHSSGPDDHSFLPPVLVSSRILSPILWTPKVLDFSVVGFPESDFEVFMRFSYFISNLL